MGHLAGMGTAVAGPAQKRREIITFQVSTSNYLFLFNLRNGTASSLLNTEHKADLFSFMTPRCYLSHAKAPDFLVLSVYFYHYNVPSF